MVTACDQSQPLPSHDDDYDDDDDGKYNNNRVKQ